jgi:hypothetical protein
VEIIETDDGFELRDGNTLISKLVRGPGPTNTLVDVLAAAIATVAAGGSVVVLGFAAGGVVAPLRALGYGGRIVGVDIDRRGAEIFASVAREWCGEFEFFPADAVEWLEGTREAPRVIVDDLSTIGPGNIVKPWESLVAVPHLARRTLAAGGVFISNVLPSDGMPLVALEGNIAQPFREAQSIRSTAYENTLLLGGDALPACDATERRLIQLLEAIESTQAGSIERVESLY